VSVARLARLQVFDDQREQARGFRLSQQRQTHGYGQPQSAVVVVVVVIYPFEKISREESRDVVRRGCFVESICSM